MYIMISMDIYRCVLLMDVGMIEKWFDTKEEAVEAWNRRTFTPLVNITEEVRNMRDRGWCDQSTVLDKVNDDISKAWNTRV